MASRFQLLCVSAVVLAAGACNAILGIDEAHTGGAAGAGQGGAPQAGAAGSPQVKGAGGSGGVSCETPEQACGGQCVNVNTDARHCGACDYACEVGACEAGLCRPRAVVENVVAPYALAFDGPESIAFSSPVVGQAGPEPLQSVPRLGGERKPLFAGPQSRSRAIAVENETLYFISLDGGTVVIASTAGGAPSVIEVTQAAAQYAAFGGGDLFYSTFDGTASQVRRMARDTNTIFDVTSPRAGRAYWLGAEIKDKQTYVYSVHQGGVDDRGLWRCLVAVAAEPVCARHAQSESPFQLSLDGGQVFIADAKAGVGRVSTSDPTPSLEAVVSRTDVGGILEGVAVEGDSLYWLSYEAGEGGAAGAAGAAGAGGGGAAGAGGSDAAGAPMRAGEGAGAGGAAPSIALHRAKRDGTSARVLGRVAVKNGPYWQNPIGPAQLLIDEGYVYFSDPGTLTGALEDDNLEGVTGAADGAIYRLPR